MCEHFLWHYVYSDNTSIPDIVGRVCASSPVWNLRAVIWFHFSISSLDLLFCPVALSVFSLFLFLAISLIVFFGKFVRLFRQYLSSSCWASVRLDGGMFRILPYGTGICHYTNQIEEKRKRKKVFSFCPILSYHLWEKSMRLFIFSIFYNAL